MVVACFTSDSLPPPKGGRVGVRGKHLKTKDRECSDHAVSATFLILLIQRSGLKRDGPVFFSSSPVKVAGDERTIIAIVAPTSRRSLGEGGSASRRQEC